MGPSVCLSVCVCVCVCVLAGKAISYHQLLSMIIMHGHFTIHCPCTPLMHSLDPQSTPLPTHTPSLSHSLSLSLQSPPPTHTHTHLLSLSLTHTHTRHHYTSLLTYFSINFCSLIPALASARDVYYHCVAFRVIGMRKHAVDVFLNLDRELLNGDCVSF